jgi:hypothetical protein
MLRDKKVRFHRDERTNAPKHQFSLPASATCCSAHPACQRILPVSASCLSAHPACQRIPPVSAL